MLTLYFWYRKPGQSLRRVVDEINISPDKDVFHLRELIAQVIHADADELVLYKIPENSPLPLGHLKTTKISLSDLGDDLSIALPLATVFESEPAAGHLHLVVINLDTPLVISCWIRGRDSDIPIKLEMPWRQTVIELLGAIQEKSKHLGGVLIERLEIYRFSYSQQEDFRRIVQGTGLGSLLQKCQTLEVVFNDVPLNENVCVVVEVVGLKEKRVPDWDVAERALKKPKVAPSSLGAAEYYAIQANMDERFLDNRTVKVTRTQNESQPSPSDTNLAPFEVLYTGFGVFLDTCRTERQSQVVGGSAVLRHHVEMFAYEMARVYESESSRQSDGLRLLNHIFIDSPRAVLRPSNINTAMTDGHYVYRDHNIPCLFVEFKNEGAGSRVIPATQLASYYRQSLMNVDRKLIYCSRLPALGITVVGPVVTFYAMLWVGSVVLFPLTSGISCVPSAAGGDDRRALHGAFIAATKLLAQIGEDAEKLSNISSPPPPLSCHIFPDITELPSFPDSSTSIGFQITDVMRSGSDGRILYRAQSTSSDLDLVIKVARSYSIDLHNFCASRGHAPTIRGFKKFPGNVVVIAMDHLEGDHLGSEGSEEFRNKMAEQLKQLVKDFHLSNYVHGDLRLPNMYCVGDKINLLDFDWGGLVGEAFYPYQILTSELREGRDMNNLMITKEDDDRILDMSLKSIGS
ncbi:hypothetical protein JVT61DRAFT_828 [Boletus reticuloceps]|uniref:Uncharacterized protein n=1 Tax=Boletus reticuloceps TaxID=495285 RepID=A0A8I3AE78_9AGAM|nr:hypothetical protein JVT61DRAFT_828 [Boletus reticuloceps]